MAAHMFLFIHDAHIRQHKKSCVPQKTVVSTKKKKFPIEINVAQQNYTSRKEICRGQKKNYMTPKRRLMLTREDSC